MSVCPNCKAKMSCGCQKRKASNGQPACSSCVAKIEAQLKKTNGPNNLKKFTK